MPQIKLKIPENEYRLDVGIKDVKDVILLIEEKLELYCSGKDEHPFISWFQHRVPEKRRKENEDAYTPIVVSIGPIYYGRAQLQPMERHKYKFLYNYLQRSDLSLDQLLAIAVDIEPQVRNSYAETFEHIDKLEFAKMILLDTVFTIQLLIENGYSLNDPLLRRDITHDMILLENQFPASVIDCFFEKLYPRLNTNLENLVVDYFATNIRISFQASNMDIKDSSNMVDFLVNCLGSEIPKQMPQKKTEEMPQRTHGAIQLQAAGVKFAKLIGESSILGVRFSSKGLLEIPVLIVDDLTETLFLNMMASEQYQRHKPTFISGYIFIMGTLIQSQKDVVLLESCGIIENHLDNEEQVVRVFRNLSKDIVVDSSGEFFVEIYEGLHKFSKNYWNQWKGSFFIWKKMLKQDYFGNPWTIISVIAAFILLVLTVIQTVCAVIQL